MTKLFKTENKVKVICDNGQDITLSKFIKENQGYQPKFINVNNDMPCRYDLVYLEIDGYTYGVDIESLQNAISNVKRAYSNRMEIK
jgi:hypothetical protein